MQRCRSGAVSNSVPSRSKTRALRRGGMIFLWWGGGCEMRRQSAFEAPENQQFAPPPTRPNPLLVTCWCCGTLPPHCDDPYDSRHRFPGPRSMNENRAAAIVLAAGKGTRMKSELPKVMHRIAGRPMISHLLANLAPLACNPVAVVIAPGMERVAKTVAPHKPAIQTEQRGTAHATLCARPLLGGFTGDVLILFGDCPFITTATIRRLLERRRAADKPAVAVLGFRPADTA